MVFFSEISSEDDLELLIFCLCLLSAVAATPALIVIFVPCVSQLFHNKYMLADYFLFKKQTNKHNTIPRNWYLTARVM